MLVLMQQLILILLITASKSKSQGIQSFERNWIFHEKEIILSRDVSAPEVNKAGESRFLYALCEEGHWKSKKVCDLIIEFYTPENLVYKSVCKLNLSTENESRMIGRNFILTHLSAEKALFLWLDRKKANWASHEIFLRIRVIEWRDCRFFDAKIPVDMQNDLVDEILFNNLVVLLGNRFDVFFYSKTTCLAGRCRVSFDPKAQPIGKVESFSSHSEVTPLSQILPVNASANEGHFVFSWTSSQLTAELVYVDGQVKVLMDLQTQGYITFGLSNKYRVFGLCWLPMRGDTSVKCTQIDSKGVLLLNTTLNFGYKVLHVKMLNLAGGGLLLLQLACSDSFCVGYKTFYVSKVDGDGQHDNKPLEITGIDVDVTVLDRYRINLFEKPGGEFCVSLAGPATLSEYDVIVKKPHLTYVSKCFNKRKLILHKH